jgi:hypothetical protein
VRDRKDRQRWRPPRTLLLWPARLLGLDTPTKVEPAGPQQVVIRYVDDWCREPEPLPTPGPRDGAG